MKLSIHIAGLWIIVAGFIILSGCQPVVENIVKKKLEQEVRNTPTPQDMGNGVRLDSISAIGISIRYNYTMMNYAKGDLDVPFFYKKMKVDLFNVANNDSTMRFYKKNKVKVAFAYYYKDGTPLSTIIIKPEDYTGDKN